MKPLSIKPLLLASSLIISYVQAQDNAGKVRGIERKVLLKQQREAVQAVIGAAGEASGGGSTNPDLVSKNFQWLTLVNNQISGDGGMPDANREEMTRCAKSLNSMAWGMIISPDAAARNPEVALKLVSIALDIAGSPDPTMLDTKARALFLLGNPREAISQQEKAIEASTVAEQKTALQATLVAYRKNELPEIPPVVDEAAEPLTGVAYISSKLRTIVLPSVEFEDVSLEEVVEFFRQQAFELDKTEPDPGRKGINFVIRKPKSPQASEAVSDGGAQDPAAGLEQLRVKELRLRNVPLMVALKYVCDQTRCRLKVDDFAVTLVPVDIPEDNFSRVFRVPKDFADKIHAGTGKDTPLPPFVELLESVGIIFAGGTSAALIAPDTLMVTNTPSELDKIEQLISAISNAEDAGQ
jgi:hypothetical protein